MKKQILTIAIVLGMTLASFADEQRGGGLFQMGKTPQQENGMRDNGNPLLPNNYGLQGDQNAVNAPVGSGIALLIGLGGAYLVAKRRKED